MYGNNFNISEKRANATRAFVEAAIKTYETANNIEKPKYEGALPDATIKFYPLD